MSKLPKNYTYRPLPKELFIGFSDIEGNGLFAGEEIAKDTNLGVSHKLVDNELIRLPLGGFINHSKEENCTFVEKGDLVYLYTLKNIEIDEELVLDYNKYICNIK